MLEIVQQCTALTGWCFELPAAKTSDSKIKFKLQSTVFEPEAVCLPEGFLGLVQVPEVFRKLKASEEDLLSSKRFVRF